MPAGNPDGGQWTSGGSGRNDPRVLSDATPDPVRPGAQYAQDRLSGYPVDLREDEARGGHTIREHVGKSETYLKERVRDEALKIIDKGDDFRGLAVGSFPSLDSATSLVNSTVAQNRDMVDRVASGREASAFLTAQFGSPTGYEAYLSTFHAEPYMRETTGVGVFILRDAQADKGWRVQSAYPLR